MCIFNYSHGLSIATIEYSCEEYWGEAGGECSNFGFNFSKRCDVSKAVT